MNVVVCVKMIPDPVAPGELDPGTKTLNRSGKLIMDDSDNYGVEMAPAAGRGRGGHGHPGVHGPWGRDLRVAHRAGHGGGQRHPDLATRPWPVVTPWARPRCWRPPSPGPTLTWSAMATEIHRRLYRPRRLGAGGRVDGARPRPTFAKSIAIDCTSVKAERQTEAGFDEVTCPMPAVVTVTAGVVEPRYPSFKGIGGGQVKAGGQPDRRGRPRDRRLSQVGSAGSGQEITEVAEAEGRSAGEIVVDEGDGAQRVPSPSSSS